MQVKRLPCWAFGNLVGFFGKISLERGHFHIITHSLTISYHYGSMRSEPVF